MGERFRLGALLAALSVITFLDRVCLSVAGPAMQHDLGIRAEQWGWITGVFAAAYALFEIPTGMLGDRIGPQRVLTRIVLWWSAFTCLTGLASGFRVLVAVRFLFGVGEAGAYPNISAAIARWFPAGEQTRAQGAVWTASRLGGALGPLLIVPLQERYGWRASFFVFGALGVLWAAVWRRAAHGVTVVGVPRPRPPRLPWRTALRSPNLRSIALMYMAFGYGSYFYMSWLPTYLVSGKGFSSAGLALFSSLPFLLGAAANAAGGVAGDYLVRRAGVRRARRLIGLTGMLASALLTGGAALAAEPVIAAVLLVMAAAAADFLLPTCWATCLDIGREYAGTVSAAMNTAGQVGGFVSAILFGYAVSAWGNYDYPLLLAAGVLFAGGLLWLGIDPSKALAPLWRSQHTALDNTGR